MFPKLSELSTKIERERQRAQYNIPFQILVWGIPILVGFYISDKFTLTQNLIFTGILAVISAISFFLVRFWDLDKPRIALEKLSKKITSNRWLSIFGMVSYDGHIRWNFVIIFTLYFVGLAVFLIGGYLIELNHTSPMHLTLGSLPSTILQGDQIELPYSISYSGEHPVFDVEITVEAPGLTSNNSPIFHPAIGKQVQAGKILLNVPTSIPDGRYAISITCSFKSVREKFPLNFLQDNTSYKIEKSIEINVGK